MTQPWPDWASLLQDGAANPGSPWRNLAFGTVGPDGVPQIRTVVLRRFADRTLDIHTDTRSAKYAALLSNPAAALHGWDPAGRIQLRASGTATLHVDDAVAHAAWAGLSAATAATYRIAAGPGTPVADPGQPNPAPEAGAVARIFCVVRLAFDTLDWLHLAQGSHRRARFTWAQGEARAMWLVP